MVETIPQIVSLIFIFASLFFLSSSFLLTLRTETATYNVLAAARLYYAILYGKQAPF